jgi:NADH:ubiquinone oxidoreductase subunit 5 (subunit L)/multisubunit Na+/H+ antiporter MnhA subunit
MFWPLKLLPLVITLMGMAFSIFMYLIKNYIFFYLKKQHNFKFIYRFLIKKWYSDRLVNELISINLLKFSLDYSYTSLDRGLLEFVGPAAISKLTRNILYNSNDLIKFLPKIYY